MEREVNYLVFRYLEMHLSPEDFEQLKMKVGGQLNLKEICS